MFRLLRSKKSQEDILGDIGTQLIMAFIAIVALSVVVFKPFFYNDFEKKMINIDLALTTNTLYAGTGNTFFSYPNIPLNLYYNFNTDNSINVYEQGDFPLQSYLFITSDNIEIKQAANLSINESNKVKLIKSGNQITMASEINYNIYQEECPKLIAKPIIGSIFVMPETIEEQENRLAKKLESVLSVKLTNSIPPDFDILIELKEHEKKNQMEIYIPFNSLLSKRLACMIANNLMGKEELSKINIPIIPSNKAFSEGISNLAPYKTILSMKMGEDFANKTTNFFLIKNAVEDYAQNK
jgi:hypothetical protein